MTADGTSRVPSVPFGKADLTSCDREAIHLPGSIQPHGLLLVIETPSLRIVQAAGDTRAVVGAELDELLGAVFQETPVGRALRPGDRESFLTYATREAGIRKPHHLLSFEFNGETVEGTVHAAEGVILLELEKQLEPEPHDSLGLVQEMIQRVHNAKTIPETYGAIVDAVSAASGFDRVMLYRFLNDGTGAVEAEAKCAEAASYLGLHFPASDIPKQARALYLNNWIRVIPDASYTPLPLQTKQDLWSRGPLDLSSCSLRSVSPIHLEYLRNMGVKASMSLSLIMKGQLWGLIACHHLQPKYLGSRKRVALELFAQMASFQLETKLEAHDLDIRLRQKSISESMLSTLASESDIAAGLRRFQPRLLEYVQAEGIALWIDGTFSGAGRVPARDDVARLVEWLNDNSHEGIFETDCLSAHFPDSERFASDAAGMLALSISRSPRDYVIWFRPEIVQTVTWAGDPNKPVDVGTSERISPRQSFAAWKQIVRLHSEPWTATDIRTAKALRVVLLEVVLEHTDQLARQRERAQIQQQSLLRELDLKISQWESLARELKLETDRRAVVEKELSEVLRRTVLEQEAERQRIARELHDSLGQYLTVMRIDLEGIGRETGAGSPVKERIEKLKSLTDDVGQEMNRLAWEIRPTALDDLGLQKAIQQYIEEWMERSHLRFDVHLEMQDKRLDTAVETTLYRALQECVRNVIKHARATRVGIILESTPKEVRLIIEDDGAGFTLDPGQNGETPRFGLVGIRERLALVHGVLEVETAPGKGTTILIHVPL